LPEALAAAHCTATRSISAASHTVVTDLASLPELADPGSH
jgi:secreted trypsin-like serine protease